MKRIPNFFIAKERKELCTEKLLMMKKEAGFEGNPELILMAKKTSHKKEERKKPISFLLIPQ